MQNFEHPSDILRYAKWGRVVKTLDISFYWMWLNLSMLVIDDFIASKILSIFPVDKIEKTSGYLSFSSFENKLAIQPVIITLDDFFLFSKISSKIETASSLASFKKPHVFITNTSAFSIEFESEKLLSNNLAIITSESTRFLEQPRDVKCSLFTSKPGGILRYYNCFFLFYGIK